jgi:hypothetical protein
VLRRGPHHRGVRCRPRSASKGFGSLQHQSISTHGCSEFSPVTKFKDECVGEPLRIGLHIFVDPLARGRCERSEEKDASLAEDGYVWVNVARAAVLWSQVCRNLSAASAMEDESSSSFANHRGRKRGSVYPVSVGAVRAETLEMLCLCSTRS